MKNFRNIVLWFKYELLKLLLTETSNSTDNFLISLNYFLTLDIKLILFFANLLMFMYAYIYCYVTHIQVSMKPVVIKFPVS